jgi:transaldolase
VLYVEALAAPFTVNTMPDQTLEAFADHGTVGEFLPPNGGDADQIIAAFAQAGIDTWSAVIRAGSRRGCPPTAEPASPRGS